MSELLEGWIIRVGDKTASRIALPANPAVLRELVEGDYDIVRINDWAAMIMGEAAFWAEASAKPPNWLATEWYSYLWAPESVILTGNVLFLGRTGNQLSDWPTFLPLYWADI